MQARRAHCQLCRPTGQRWRIFGAWPWRPRRSNVPAHRFALRWPSSRPRSASSSRPSSSRPSGRPRSCSTLPPRRGPGPLVGHRGHSHQSAQRARARAGGARPSRRRLRMGGPQRGRPLGAAV